MFKFKLKTTLKIIIMINLLLSAFASYLAGKILEDSSLKRAKPKNQNVITSDTVELIKKHEGLRLNAYRDPVGIPTIGYGHTSGVYMGMSITPMQAEAYLYQDLKNSADWLNSYLKSRDIKLNQNQYSALISFVFNVKGKIRDNSGLDNLLKTKQFEKVPDKLREYNKGTIDGKLVVLPGLTKRRNDEAELFSKK